MNTTCAPARGLVQRRLDGDALVTREQEILAEHLAACPACRSFALDLERVVDIIEHLPAESAPPALVGSIMLRVPAAQSQAAVRSGWLERIGQRLPRFIGQSWALLAGLAGLLILIYQTVAVRGVSLLNLPGAFAEWVGLVDLSHLESLLQATSLFAGSVGAELLVGVSLVVVAIFAVMAQALAHPPATRMLARH